MLRYFALRYIRSYYIELEYVAFHYIPLYIYIYNNLGSLLMLVMVALYFARLSYAVLLFRIIMLCCAVLC